MGNEDTLEEDKVMMVSRTEEEGNLNIDGEDIEHVKELKYLGAVISADCKDDEVIEQHVGAAAKVVGQLRRKCWKDES